MKKVGFLSLLAVLLLGLALAVSGCGGKQNASAPEENQQGTAPSGTESVTISIGTAKVGGVFYPLGVGMAELINKNIPGAQANAEETGGDRANLSLMQQKKIEMGMITTYTAKPALKDTPIKYGWKLFDDPVTFVALKNKGIKNIADLKGKKVSLGAAGSAANVLGQDILKAHGLGEKDYTPVYQGWTEAVDALSDGQIDAIAVMGASPVPAVQALAAQKDIVLVTADKAAVEQYFAGKAVFPMEIPANTYKGQTEPAIVANTPASIWFLSEVSEDTAYQITKTIFTNIDYMKSVHAIAAGFELPNGQLDWAEVHPGVKKYVQEIGKW